MSLNGDMMRNLGKYFLLLYCFLGVFSLAAQETSFQTAEQAYTSNDYAKAIEQLTSMLEQDENPAIYANLGNAYYAMGDYAPALLAYRRAQALNPRDVVLQQQIALLQARTGQLTTTDANADPFAITESFTANELALVGFILWCLFWLQILLIMYQPNRRSQAAPFIAITALIFAVNMGLFGVNLYRPTSQPAAVTMQDSIVRSGPAESYPLLYTLPAARDIRIAATEGDWLRFTTHNGQIGWLMSNEIERVQSCPAATK